MKTIFALLIFVFMIHVSYARIEVHQFKNQQQEQRYKKLINELRCLVCQNQNLADSNAELAQDLRKKVYEMVMEDKSNKVIQEYMVDRYGDFVLYRPPFKMRTALLWIGPFIILGTGLILLFTFIIKRNKNNTITLSDDDRERVSRLLGDTTGEEK